MGDMPASEQRPSTLVLLEGPSDVAAVTGLLAHRAGEVGSGPGAPAYSLVDLGGVTNVGAHLQRATALSPVPRLLGLCDRGESRVVVAALRRIGRDVSEPEDLPGEGFFVCDRDLEEELIRALGPDGCLDLLEEVGLGARFAAFSRQRAWAGRPLSQRLHRFSGTTAGRKIMLAGAMAAALGPERAPGPLAALIDALQGSAATA